MLKDKRILVTGATGGLGRSLVIRFAKEGAQVIALARSAAKLDDLKKAAGGNVRTETVDLSDRAAVRQVAERLLTSLDKIDVLVSNAAVYKNTRSVKNGIEEMFGTNHLAPFVLTTRLQPLLAKGDGRVILVSAPSTTKLDFADLQGEKKFSAFNAFGASKAANLLFTYEYARRTKGTGITVDAVHPGLMKSELMNESAWLVRTLLGLVSQDPDKSAAAIVRIADQPGTDGEGRFFKMDKVSKPPAPSQDRDAQKMLWEASEKLAD